jgi:fructokinase
VNIVCIGEALIDFKDAGKLSFQGFVGGSPLNVAVAAARLGGSVAFASQVSTDLFGEAIVAFMGNNAIDTRFVERSDDPTTLAFVSEQDGDAHFTFLGSGTADTRYDPNPLPRFPDTVRFVQYGSISILREPIARSVQKILTVYKGQATTVFDPNIRPALIANRQAYLEQLEDWLSLASLVKVSTQDLNWLYPDENPLSAAEAWLSRGPVAVVTTQGPKGATLLRTGYEPITIGAPAIDVVDTVGAGDTFTGALMVALSETGHDLRDLHNETWLGGLRFAAAAAALNCTRAGANPPDGDEVNQFNYQSRQ